MAACCFCHLVVINMSRSSIVATNCSHFCAHGLWKFNEFRNAQKVFGSGYGLVLQRKLKFVVAAELPKPPFSLDFGLDSQSLGTSLRKGKAFTFGFPHAPQEPDTIWELSLRSLLHWMVEYGYWAY